MVLLAIGSKTPKQYMEIGNNIIDEANNWGITQSIDNNNPSVRRVIINIVDDIPAAGATGGQFAVGMRHNQVGSSVTIDLRAFVPGSSPKSPVQVLYHEIGHVTWPGAAPPDGNNPNGNHLIRTESYGASFAEYLRIAAAADGFVLGADDIADAKNSYDPQCFLTGTEITMWDGSKKPIEEIAPNDRVLSHDKHGNAKPGRVVRTFTNDAKIILDFHGTFVTPGHVYFCAGGKYAGRFAPLIDILRDDGVVQHEDGTLIRAATGCAVGSEDDRELWAITAYEDADGRERVRDKKKLRLGTRWMLPNGQHFTMRDYMDGIGLELLDTGYVRFKQTGLTTPFIWTFSDRLPNPEDFVLGRSQTSLEDIYRADQWEAMPPSMPVPLRRDSGPVAPLSERQLDAMARNMPMAFDNESPSSHVRSNRPRMNRKQRLAQEAKMRASASARRRAMH